MTDAFFQQPILNSPYEPPGRHWELDPSGQPTQLIIERRRRADFITPIPKRVDLGSLRADTEPQIAESGDHD